MTLYLYLDNPVPLLKARLNMPSATYPISDLIFDGVTVGAYTAIYTDLTILIGSADGLDDYGRLRIQGTPTATTIPVGRISQGIEDGEVTIVDNAYLTIWKDFRIWAKPPYIVVEEDGATTQYKDSNISVGMGDYTTTGIPPVANLGPGFAGTINSVSGKITVFFTGINSFAVADGATIASYAWDIADGTVTIGDVDEDDLTVTFPAGFRWVSLTVTDSLGNTHTARCPVFARDPANDVTIQNFNAQFRITPTGQTVQLAIKEDIDRDTYPDGMLVMLWEGESSAANTRNNIRFIGWHQSDEADVRATRTGNIRDTTLTCVDALGRMQSLPGFSQHLASNDAPTNFDEMSAPTMDKFLHYLLHWHSTLLALADYFPSGTGDDYPFVEFDSNAESLFDQVTDHAKRLLPDHIFTCNQFGQCYILPDPMVRDVADRTVTSMGTFTEDYTANIRFTHTRPPKVHWLRGHALLTQSAFTDVDGVDTLLVVQCIAPGLAPGQGLGEVVTSEGIVPSQAVLNSVTGHRYARLNSRYSQVSIATADESGFDTIQPARMEWVNVDVTAATAAQRGFLFTNTRALCSEISRRYEASRTGTVVRADYTLEIETVGTPAVTVIPIGQTYSPYVPTPPDFGLITGQQKVAVIARELVSGNLAVISTTDFQSANPTWTKTNLITGQPAFSFVADPFSPGYISGSGAINGYVADRNKIVRINDIFGSPSATDLYTFATVVNYTSGENRRIDASFGRFFSTDSDNPWLVCASYYYATVGKGVTIVFSKDAGATWSTEVSVTTVYDHMTEFQERPVGLYVSPRTPGLCYVFAFVTAGSGGSPGTPSIADGYYSTDWGAGWLPMAGADPDVFPLHGLGIDMHVPWVGADETLIYHGTLEKDLVGTDQAFYGLIRTTGTSYALISPVSGGIFYGPAARKFSIRAYDNDRQKMVMAGKGNDVSLGPDANDKFAAFVSSNAGDTWTQIIAPIARTSSSVPLPTGAAFAGDDSDVIWIWGNGGYMKHSIDFGANILNKEGTGGSKIDVTMDILGIVGGIV